MRQKNFCKCGFVYDLDSVEFKKNVLEETRTKLLTKDGPNRVKTRSEKFKINLSFLRYFKCPKCQSKSLIDKTVVEHLQ
jgi:rubredoxin